MDCADLRNGIGSFIWDDLWGNLLYGRIGIE